MIRVKLKLDKQSSDAVRRKLQEVIAAVGDPTPANRNVSIWLHRWVNENFVSEGGKVGGWKKFKIGGRRKKVNGKWTIDTTAKLLQDTGLLRKKFHSFYGRTFAGIGNNQPYSLAHEEGLPLRGLEARRMLPSEADDDVTEKVIQIYDAYIEKAMR